MIQGEHSAILSIFIELPFVIKILVLSIFEWPLYTSFTVVVFFLSEPLSTIPCCTKVRLGLSCMHRLV